jgi:hypothetical protein
MKSPQEDIDITLRASRDHLLITPPSHFIHHKAKGWAMGLFVEEGQTINQKILFWSQAVKGKIPPLFIPFRNGWRNGVKSLLLTFG